MGHRRQCQRRLPDGDRRAGHERSRRPATGDADRALPAPGADRAVRGRGHDGSRRAPVRDRDRVAGDVRRRRSARDHPAARHVRRADAGRPVVHRRGPGRDPRLRRLRAAAGGERGSEAGDDGAARDAGSIPATRGSAPARRPARRASAGGSRSPITSRSMRSACCWWPTRSRRRCSTPSCRWRGRRRSS